MKVGLVGLGKLGMPIAVAMGYVGHFVIGTDTNRKAMTRSEWPFKEEGYDGETFARLLWTNGPNFGSLRNVVEQSQIVFVAVQTPHQPQFEGVSALSDERADFDYTWLKRAVTDIAFLALEAKKHTVVCIISTVLPGTTRREILPLCNEYIHLAYNPAFPAMGTVISDYLRPEFVLLGCEDETAEAALVSFYVETVRAPIVQTTIETAEAIKVLYNTFITSKLVFANAAMELCHKVGASIDDVSDALALGTRRITSPAYLKGGMGDGGACHPRDNIALSWLARNLNLSFNLFDALMTAREKQARWLCTIAIKEHILTDLDICILGSAFKAETNIETGSAALLCANLIQSDGFSVHVYDPIAGRGLQPAQPHVFLVGTKHSCFTSYKFPEGSVVIDPWRFIPDQPGVRVVRIGEP